MPVFMLLSKTNQNNNLIRGLSSPSVRIVAVIFSVLAPMCVQAQSAAELLAQADHFGDQSDWYDAGQLYARAEAEFHKTGDSRNELYAKFGRLHREIENGSYSAVRAEVVK